MADLSLDEFIRKKKVNVKKVNILQKRLGTKTPLQKKLQQPFVKAANRPIPRKFDARQKLGPKNILDARDKIIINKKSGAGDARNKIVQKQVQKGTFDARSLLQRQAKKSKRRGKRVGNLPTDGLVQSGGLITRTLSNPGAQGKAQVQVTSSGLIVTRPIPSTQVSISGNSLQVTKRTRPFESDLTDAVPIIQIRNDRYRQPAQQTVVIHASQPSGYLSQSSAKHSSYQSYNPQNYSYNEPSYPSHRSYKDYDDPLYNPASIATDVPKIQISNMRPVETSAIRPVTYSGDFSSQIRGPPGAATVSQGAKLPLTKTVLQTTKLTPTGVKRRQAQQEVAGPLRLGKGGGPGIEMGTGEPSFSKKAKVIPLVSDLDIEELQDDRSEIISPLQGFRVMVTNLFSGVTQDDIIELFGAVGPLKKAKLLKPGNAEVVYVNKEDALSAIQKYHSRELDGQPMYVKMTTPIAAVVKKAVGDVDPDITGEALRLYKKGSGIGSLPEAAVETATIHRALFKAGPPGPNKSVRFTVKI
ncbi:polymerase delta-interacting protein 3-like [Physella acuta]|uniref:polymerase delta-interacting protein 3-like n=1 Tax=Physella acuta TaxID=109671 RepID=UPI0027DD01D1|nr:polymerase delta-interacting protein 3-like [Physella acuta]